MVGYLRILFVEDDVVLSPVRSSATHAVRGVLDTDKAYARQQFACLFFPYYICYLFIYVAELHTIKVFRQHAL